MKSVAFLRIQILLLASLFGGVHFLSAQEFVADSLVADTAHLCWAENVCHGLDSLLCDEMFERSQVGLLVFDLTADSVVYNRGARQLLRPASVEKLLTAITALRNLGGSYQLTTGLYLKGQAVDSIWMGDLYVRGGFDPRFGSDDMEAFVEALGAHGLKGLEGNVFSDLSLKDTLKWGEGWCWDDEEKTLTPLLYNGRDCFMPKFYEYLDAADFSHPEEYTPQPLPDDSVVLLIERFHTIDQVLMRMLKNSDNLYAEALFYQLGASEGTRFASARVSAEKVNNLIRKLHLNPDDYNVADGSGLSLYNYTTPECIVAALRYAYERNDIYLHLLPALPIAGVDGTLERRMVGTAAEANVRAKTGTLRGVSTLAGYATAPNGHELCFCIMNQGIRTRQEAHDFQNKVCILLVQP